MVIARYSNRHQGFTLIELLVVVAIIAVLAAILFPVFVKAKDTARNAKCQSNLRLIGQAFSLYLDDWNNVYPNTGDPYLWMGRRWRWPLHRYLALTASRDPLDPDDPNKSAGNTGGIIICPSDVAARGQWDSTSYGYSAAFYHTPEQVNSMTTAQLWDPANPGPPCFPQPASEVMYPSRKSLVADWLSNHSEKKASWWSWEGTRNYLFADGHVRLLKAAAINPSVTGLPDINLTVNGVHGQDIN